MASRRIFINISADVPSAAFVKSFTESSAANPIVIARSDSFDLELHFLAVNSIPTPGRPFVYVNPATWSGAKFAMGGIGAQPDSGTFTITSSVSGTTGNIAYNASASTVATALSALGGLSGVTVTSTTTGVWNVDSGSATASPVVTLTASAAALAPDGSTVQITKTQTANGSLHNRWIISLAKALPVLNTTWAALPSALVTVTTVQAGSGDANKTFRVVWNANAYFGGVLLSFFDGTNTFTLGPIAYNSQSSDVAAAFSATGATNSVTVVQNNLGDFTIACTGSNISGSDDPTLATSSNTLIVPVGYIGTVTASTAGVDNILNGATSASTYCEVEIRQIVGEPQTVAQINNAVFIADLIGNTPGFATGTEDWATIPDVRAISPQYYSTRAALLATAPEHVGQYGLAGDVSENFIGSGTGIGDWSSFWGADDMRVGRGGVYSGTFIYLNASNGFTMTVSAPNTTANRTIAWPDLSGTVALTGSSTSSAYVAKTANYTVTATDSTINCTSGTFTVTLLTAVGIPGQSFAIKNSGSGTITVNTTSSQFIDGALTQTLSAGQSITVQSTNAGWIIT